MVHPPPQHRRAQPTANDGEARRLCGEEEDPQGGDQGRAQSGAEAENRHQSREPGEPDHHAQDRHPQTQGRQRPDSVAHAGGEEKGQEGGDQQPASRGQETQRQIEGGGAVTCHRGRETGHGG